MSEKALSTPSLAAQTLPGSNTSETKGNNPGKNIIFRGMRGEARGVMGFGAWVMGVHSDPKLKRRAVFVPH